MVWVTPFLVPDMLKVVDKIPSALDVGPTFHANSGVSASPGVVNWWSAQAGQRWEEVVKKSFASFAEGNNVTTWVTSGFTSVDPWGRGVSSSSPLIAVNLLSAITGPSAGPRA